MNNTNQYRSPANIVQLLAKIDKELEPKMEDAEGIKKAFYFGHLNLATALTYAIMYPDEPMRICMDYRTALDKYRKASRETEEEMSGFHQLTLDELFPALMNMLGELTNKKEPKTSTRNTRKPKQKQE